MRLADSLKLWSLCAAMVGSSSILVAPAAQAQLLTPAQQAQIQSTATQAYGMSQSAKGTSRANLPPTNMDSFVRQAGGMADLIYGDESDGLPPFFGFDQSHRINAGIMGINDAGLTTGHGSVLPDAWGSGYEWGMAGSNYGNRALIADAALNAADLLEMTAVSVLNLWDNPPQSYLDAAAANFGAAVGAAIGDALGGAVGGAVGSSVGAGF